MFLKNKTPQNLLSPFDTRIKKREREKRSHLTTSNNPNYKYGKKKTNSAFQMKLLLWRKCTWSIYNGNRCLFIIAILERRYTGQRYLSIPSFWSDKFQKHQWQFQFKNMLL